MKDSEDTQLGILKSKVSLSTALWMFFSVGCFAWFATCRIFAYSEGIYLGTISLFGCWSKILANILESYYYLEYWKGVLFLILETGIYIIVAFVTGWLLAAFVGILQLITKRLKN